MGTELYLERAHYQTGAGECVSGTTGSRGPSAAPSNSRVLLDLRAGSDEASLHLLALAAVSALSDLAGCTLDCAVSFAAPRQVPLTAATSGPAADLARADQDAGLGPVSQALGGHLAVIANSSTADPRWPDCWNLLRNAGYRSLVSVPLFLQPGSMSALTLFATEDNVFTPSVTVAVTAYSGLAAASLLRASELRAAECSAAQLHRALQGRAVIDVACGVIMSQNHCSYREAFRILAKASSNRNVKARVVAESILRERQSGAPSSESKA